MYSAMSGARASIIARLRAGLVLTSYSPRSTHCRTSSGSCVSSLPAAFSALRLRGVEDDVRPLRNEALIEQEVRDVRDSNAGTRGQSDEPRRRHQAVQVADYVLDGEPVPHTSGIRPVQGVIVDSPSARRERFRTTVGESESRSRGAPVVCDTVSQHLPAELQGCLGDAGSGCQGRHESDQYSEESVAHERDLGKATAGNVICELTTLPSRFARSMPLLSGCVRCSAMPGKRPRSPTRARR